jgi:hypothetical protein
VLAREADGTVLVVDYKTDRLAEDEEPEDLVARSYATQRMVYALAALRDGAPRVEVAYALLERPAEPVTAVFTAADVPALADALADLADGILAERWPVAARPHRELCGECPGRAALCSWPETMTLRPAADAYAEGADALDGVDGDADAGVDAGVDAGAPRGDYAGSAGTFAGSGGPS